jgi:hypothetical protein
MGNRPLTDTASTIAEATCAVALRTGIVLALVCLVLLVAAVGMTWYGPAGHGQAHAVGQLTGPGEW